MNHPVLGYITEAYRISVLPSGQWSVDIKKITDTASRFLTFELNKPEKELLEMTQHTKEETVLVKFSLLRERKPTPNNTFFSDKSIQQHILPYVSNQTAAIINKMNEYEIPLYIKHESKGIISEEPIKIEPQNAEPRFYFDLSDKAFTYSLSVYQQNSKLQLNDAKILTRIPCFIKIQNTIYMLPDDFDGQLLKPFQKTDTIVIPSNKVSEYLNAFVSKIIRKYRVDVSGFTVKEIHPELTPVISISKLHKKTPVVELSFNYENENFLAHASQDFALRFHSRDSEISFTKIFRNKAAEELVIKQIESFGFFPVLTGYLTFRKANNDDTPLTYLQILNEISKRSSLLKNIGVKYNIIIDNKQYLIEEPNIKTEIIHSNDWFDLKIVIKINEFSIPFQKIIPNIIACKQEYILPDNSVAILPEEWFSRFKDLSVLSEQCEKTLKIHKSQVNLIESVDNSACKEVAGNLRQLINNEIPCRNTPYGLNATLRDYQKKGFEWLTYMHECGLGGCLADDMGLGKTIQVLTYFLSLSQNSVPVTDSYHGATINKDIQLSLFDEKENIRRLYTHLIVAPLSLLHNWIEEIVKFAPALKTILYSGTERYRLYHEFQYADIVLTSYGVVRNDIDILQHFSFHTIILDESQFIKNPDSKSYDALLMLSSKQRFVLTGTPLENSLTDIWSQMNFLNPKMLGSLKIFKDTYVIPVEKNNDEGVSKRIQKLIGSFILRRTKIEVTPELPLLTEKICYCTMSDEQKSIYEQKKSEIRNFLIENAGNFQRSRKNIIVLSGLMKLRLIANHPKLILPQYSGTSGKFEEICQHIDKVVSEGHKTIVFSQFIKHLNIIRQYLDEKNISYEILTGQTTQAERQKNIHNFMKNDKVRLFLMTLKAGGVGLNLTKADYVFVLDPWWNPASENQAINRTHRIGQDKKIFAYRFISRETIEEKIMILQQKKSDLFNNIINSTSFSKLTENELLTLFE